MALVTSKEIAQVIGLENFGFLGTFIGWLLIKVLRISAINKIYNNNKSKSDLDFLNGVLDDCNIKFEIPEEDLKRIPKEGSFITVSNHPLGGIDGVLLLKLLIEKRADYKIIANFLLHRIVPLKPYVMPVNPFETRKDAKSSIAGIKSALLHLKEGKPLGIFPAGEVSTYKDGKLKVDKPWEEGAVRLIKKAQVPVIPIYFHAKNSWLFYFLSKVSDTLRTAKLPSEVISQKGRIIKVRIGKPISVKDQNEYKEISAFYEFIRKKTYMLANPFEKAHKLISTQHIKIKKKPKEITGQRSVDSFVKEGKIRQIGLSNETPWGVMRYSEEAKKGAPKMIAVQNAYNLLNRRDEIGLSEVLLRENIGYLAYSPLAFGVLAGKYLNNNKPENARVTLFPNYNRYSSQQSNKATMLYNEIAKKHGISLTQMALAFVTQQPFITSNIIGATNLNQLKENIDSIHLSLSDEIISEINTIHNQIPNPAP